MTRHELKEQIQHDHFRDAVSGAVSYATSNRERVIRWGIAILIALIVVVGVVWYARYTRSVRQQDLQAAFAVAETPVGPSSSSAQQTYPTQDAKQLAEMKAFSGVVAKDGGSREGLIARYYLGTLKADRGDVKGAESDLRAVADSSNETAPLAKIALAQLYAGENRVSDAQKVLRSLVNKPTDLVSKDQAEILLAQLEQTSNPKDARKLLQSLRTARPGSAVNRAVDQISADLSK